jgi:hypothetical protein
MVEEIVDQFSKTWVLFQQTAPFHTVQGKKGGLGPGKISGQKKK